MKAWAYLAILVLLAGAVAGAVHIVRKAQRVDVAEARAEAAERGRKDDMDEIVKRLDKDAVDRKDLLDRFAAIDERFDELKLEMPKPADLVQRTEIPGESCPRVGVSESFVSVYNQSSSP